MLCPSRKEIVKQEYSDGKTVTRVNFQECCEKACPYYIRELKECRKIREEFRR